MSWYVESLRDVHRSTPLRHSTAKAKEISIALSPSVGGPSSLRAIDTDLVVVSTGTDTGPVPGCRPGLVGPDTRNPESGVSSPTGSETRTKELPGSSLLGAGVDVGCRDTSAKDYEGGPG